MTSFPYISKKSGNLPNGFSEFVCLLQEPVAVFDKEHRLVMANSKWYSTFDLKEDALCGSQLFDIAGGLFGGEEMKYLVQEWLPTHSSGGSYEVGIGKSGENILGFQVGVSRLTGVEDDAWFYAYTFRQIPQVLPQDQPSASREKLASGLDTEKAGDNTRMILGSEARFQAMLEYSKDIFLITTPEKLLYVSANVYDILGYTLEEFSHTPAELIVHPDDQPLRWGELEVPGSTLVLEYRMKHKDGSWKWIEAKGVNLFNHPDVEGMVFNLRDITEKKESLDENIRLNKTIEEKIALRTLALRTSEGLLRDAQKISKIGSWELDLLTGQVVWSDQLFEIFQIPNQEGAPPFEAQEPLFPPEDWALLNEKVARAIELGEPYELDMKILRDNGSVGYINAKGQPFADFSGKIIRLMGTAMDFSERKAVEQTLEKTSERLKVATASANIGIYEWDIEQDMLYWDETMHQIFGVRKDEFSGDFASWSKTLLPEDLAPTVFEVQQVLAGTKDYDTVFRIIHSDGSIRYIKAYGVVHRDEQGKPLRLLGTNQDITQLKEAEAVIAAQRETFNLILEQSMAGYWDKNLENGTIYMSPTFKKMFGYEEHEIANTQNGWMDLVFEEDLASIERAREAHINSQGEIPYSIQARFRHKNGSTVSVLRRGSVISWDENGKPLRMVGSHTDVTQLVETVSKLEKSRKELESFSYSVSHDLRAPLRGIDGWSLALVEDYEEVLDERGKGYLQRVRSETQRMGQLIDDLLKLSRISRSQVVLKYVKLSEIAAEISKRIAPDYPQVNFKIKIDPFLVARADKNLMEILLTNLLSNAFKFSSKVATPEIHFGSTIMEGQKVFFVRDNGAGFNMNLSKNLFGAFQRLHKQSDFPGTGIGLVTVQRVISLHGGKVWAEAEPGKGATFYFLLNP